jgi:hypothetical protein
VLIFCIFIIHGVEFRILEVKQYFVNLFILLHAINIDFIKAVNMSVYLLGLFVLSRVGGVRVAKNTCSSSDDWIY